MALFDRDDAGGISASSRWLRSGSDDTTGRQRDIRSSTPAGVPAAFFIPYDRWCRFAQPPATRFDASGIILIRCIMCGRNNYKAYMIKILAHAGYRGGLLQHNRFWAKGPLF
jgi:hypothetical protein